MDTARYDIVILFPSLSSQFPNLRRKGICKREEKKNKKKSLGETSSQQQLLK